MKLFYLPQNTGISSEKNITDEKVSPIKVSPDQNQSVAEKQKLKKISVDKPKPENQNKALLNTTADSLIGEEIAEELFYEEDTNNYYDTILSASDSQFISFAKDNFEDTSVSAITVDTSIAIDSIIEEPLEVKKEQVLGMITLTLINLDIDTSDNSENDSIISQLSNIKDKEIENISVAFWSSPINFKGYKFNGNKLIMYGLTYQEQAAQNARIYQFENQIYLQYFGVFYRIQNSLQYKTYEQVLDSILLKVFR